MTELHPALTFRVTAEVFPGQEWQNLCRELGARPAQRHTESHPTWKRIDGKGYTIWVSDVCLVGNASSLVLWEIKMESLAALPSEGLERWTEIVNGMRLFFDDRRLPLETI